MYLKKPKFWDLKKPSLISYLLMPLTIILKISNLFLDFTNKKKFKDIKTLCIGNIYLGGTGKTPTTINIYNIMRELDFKVVTAKKYYSNQFDEAEILKNKSFFISLKNRSEIIKTAIDKKYDAIIFDDGLQERFLDYDLKFVCFDSQKWIGNGCLIPSGPLRESIECLKKYDGIFLKNTSRNNNLNEIYSKIKKINPKIEIFNSFVEILNIEKFDLDNNYLIFSGIGNSESFKETLVENKFNIIEELIFPDHYNYKKEDISRIVKKANKINAKIVTTEKDYIKITNDINNDINFIEINFKIDDEEKLKKLISSKLNETS